MNREELLSAVEALVEDELVEDGATLLKKYIAREIIYYFIGSITDEDTLEVVDFSICPKRKLNTATAATIAMPANHNSTWKKR